MGEDDDAGIQNNGMQRTGLRPTADASRYVHVRGEIINVLRYSEVVGISRPIVSKFRLFVDDGGSRQENLLGYSVIVLDEFAAKDLDQRVAVLLRKYNIKEYHAKDVKSRNLRKYDKAYTDLFDQYAEAYKKATLRFCTSRLGPLEESNTNYAYVKKTITSILDSIGVSSSSITKLVDPSTYLALPLLDFVSSVRTEQTANVVIGLVIDRTRNYDKLVKERVALPGNIAVSVVPFNEAVTSIVNALLKTVTQSTLRLSSVFFGTPECYRVLQVVDAIANFSLNFIRVQVDATAANSTIKTFKSQKFEYLMRLFNMDKPRIAKIKKDIATNWKLSGSQLLSQSGQAVSLFKFT